MNVRDLIKNSRLAKDLTMKELADKVGVSEGTISRWESGEVANMKRNSIIALAKALSIAPSALVDCSNVDDEQAPDSPPRYIRIPVIGEIAGGVPIEAIENLDSDEWEEIPADWLAGGKEYLALKVQGDSMAPRIANGDVAIIRKQLTFENGEICAVYVNGYNATLKRIVRLPGGALMLQPLNQSYDPQVYTKKEQKELPVIILGKLVELRAKF